MKRSFNESVFTVQHNYAVVTIEPHFSYFFSVNLWLLWRLKVRWRIFLCWENRQERKILLREKKSFYFLKKAQNRLAIKKWKEKKSVTFSHFFLLFFSFFFHFFYAAYADNLMIFFEYLIHEREIYWWRLF